MEVIHNLAKSEISSSILRLHRDIENIETLIKNINDTNDSLDKKYKDAVDLYNKLKVYDYIVNQLLNIAEKWCADHHSPVYWAVMQDRMETCNACNAGQSTCASAFYSIAQGLGNETAYGFCNDCQSVFSVEDTLEDCTLCYGNTFSTDENRPTTCYHQYTYNDFSCESQWSNIYEERNT
jgi:hypothetical protein